MKFIINVLVTSAGGIVGEGIIKSLKFFNKLDDNTTNYKYEITSVDMNLFAVGLFRTDHGFVVPQANSPDYLDELIRIIKNQDIDIILVGSDKELFVLSEFKYFIEKETSAKVVVASRDILEITRDKWNSMQFLKKNNFPYIHSVLPDDADSIINEFGFPLVVKPREGFGSRYFYVVEDIDELTYSISQIKKIGWRPIIQEFLKLDEFTTGIVVDKNSNQILSSISMKKEIKNGQTNKAFVDDFSDIRKLSETIASRLRISGPVNIQSMVRCEDNNTNSHYIIEINPRFSATCPIRTIAGVNEPDIVIQNFLFNEQKKINSYNKLISMRYWNEVYLNKDTKIEDNKSFVVDYF